MVPGDYTALLDLKIRLQMDTQSATNQVGVYTRGVNFTVYEVYPEKNGILWGRVSSNTGTGSSRFVGLRVANQAKAKLEKGLSILTPRTWVSEPSSLAMFCWRAFISRVQPPVKAKTKNARATFFFPR